MLSEASLGLKPGWFQLTRLLGGPTGDGPLGEGDVFRALFIGEEDLDGSCLTGVVSGRRENLVALAGLADGSREGAFALAGVGAPGLSVGCAGDAANASAAASLCRAGLAANAGEAILAGEAMRAGVGDC